jgi:two-component system sensor histidine kinase KdpD
MIPLADHGDDAARPADSAAADTADVAGLGDGAEAAGHFRIYLAAAAGAGKTIAMLDEGQRRRQRGADVVIAFAQSHGRPVTQARMTGLEMVPRQVTDYRGTQFEELDLDAVIRRHPRVALVDELAHTNVPGSGRHSKRWQDVLEMLDAGIDVVTTVNIQHLESVADTAGRITGVPVRERVPDWVVRRADRIELVDSSPEQLRGRMVNGNIYPPEQVPQALTHFFRADNLTALRELALRFLADETGEGLRQRLARRRALAHWEMPERILVGVTAAPGSEAVVRRAAQLAARTEAGLDVVHVTVPDTGGAEDGDSLSRVQQVASDVGATWHQLTGTDPDSVLIEFARTERITMIVIGASQHGRWAGILADSTVRRVSRLAAEAGIDVHIVAPGQTPA